MSPNRKGLAAFGAQLRPSEIVTFQSDNPKSSQAVRILQGGSRNPALARPRFDLLRLVETGTFARPPAPRRLTVRFYAFDGYAPHGRSRVFDLWPQDLAELIVTAELMEGRR